jgi:hypothetical protein
MPAHAVFDWLSGFPQGMAARAILLRFSAESAHAIDDKADDQKQAKATAAHYGTPVIKPAAAKHQKKNQQDN